MSSSLVNNRVYQLIEIENLPTELLKVRSGNPPRKCTRTSEKFSGLLRGHVIPERNAKCDFDLVIAAVTGNSYSDNLDFGKNNVKLKLKGKAEINVKITLEFLTDDSIYSFTTSATVVSMKNYKHIPSIKFIYGNKTLLNEEEKSEYNKRLNTEADTHPKKRVRKNNENDITPDLDPSITFKIEESCKQLIFKDCSQVFKIGRSGNCDIKIDDDYISRIAATVKYVKESTNHIFILAIVNKSGAILYTNSNKLELGIGDEHLLAIGDSFTFPTNTIANKLIKVENICYKIESNENAIHEN